jgi:hypothetical protein
MLRFAILAPGQRKSGLPDLRHLLPISGKPEIGVSFRSRKGARCTRPGHETSSSLHPFANIANSFTTCS